MAFKIHGEVSLDGAMFKRGLHEIGGEASAFIKNFALGAIGVYSIEQALDKTVETAEELVNTSRKLSTTVEELQVMRQAAKENGLEFQTMATALERFNAVRENALRGGKGSAEQLAALRRLGVTREDLQNRTASQNLTGNISETARKSNAADIAKDLKDVFGRGGQELFGVLQTDFAELAEKMKSMGAIMDSTTAHELKMFKDEMDLIGSIIGATLAPLLVSFGAGIYNVITWLGTLGTFLGDWMASLAAHPFDVLFGDAGKTATEDAVEAAKEFSEKRNEAWDEMVKKANTNPINPPAIIEDESKEKIKKAASTHSDSLIAAGNFLGAGRGAISNVAERHLQVARDHLAEAKKEVVVLTNIQKATEDMVKAFKGQIPDWASD